jgi:DNA repair protein RadA/Sms
VAQRVPIESLPEAAIASERTILGFLLLEPDRFPEIELARDDFGTDAHREIFAAICNLHADGETTWDSVSVLDALQKKGKLAAVGGAAYLADLTTGIPRTMAVGYHVQQVREAGLRRRLGKVLQRALSSVHDAGISANGLLVDVLGRMQRLAEGFDGCGNLLPYSPETGNTERCPELVCLSDVQPSAVDWLWEPYLPSGMLAMLSGDPGGGKTYLALAIAAALSKGHRPYTNEPCSPVSTLYLSLENSPEHVVRPRFDLLQGDARRFHLLTGSTNGKSDQCSSISLQDVKLLRKAITEKNARLLVVDPIQSYLGADVDAHRSNETRPVLDGLSRLASEQKCCILLVRHLSKSSGGRAIHRGLGSIDLTGAVRTELMVGTPADDPDSRAMVQVKSNLGRFGHSLGFTIGEDGFSWTGKSSLTSSDLIAPQGDAETRSEFGSAVEYLENELADGPKRQRDLLARGRFSERTLQRARARIGAERSRDGEGGAWLWRLKEA